MCLKIFERHRCIARNSLTFLEIFNVKIKMNKKMAQPLFWGKKNYKLTLQKSALFVDTY